MSAVGAAGVVWPQVNQMEPDSAVLAATAPVDIDIGAIAPGQQILIMCRGQLIFIINRPSAVLDTLKSQAIIGKLSNPNSEVMQQPIYAKNWHRSIKSEFAVLVAICTHLGCIPSYKPNKGQVNASWFGGYFGLCHGSKYDLAGRVFRGVSAPYKLPVPPYRFVGDKTLRIGENPPGQTFDLSSIVQV